MSVHKTTGPIARLYPFAERVRAWFFAGSCSALAAWLALVLLLATILVWFFLFSPYGTPAAPVYSAF